MDIRKILLIVVIGVAPGLTQQETLPELTRQFDQAVRPFLAIYCLDCHGETVQEAKLDLSTFNRIAAVQADLGHWKLVLDRLKVGEMPPEDAPEHPTEETRREVGGWIESLRLYEAGLNAGDPGPVLARRLNNPEYDYTIRDLTGVDIQPTREFPIDPANEAGFANSGESLAMSPALLDKYLAAARHVGDHLVLMPQGLTFASHPALTYSDRDKFAVRRIVEFYLAQKTDYVEYFLAAWQFRHRRVLEIPAIRLADIAANRGISSRYLETVWQLLHDGKNHHGPVAALREKWRSLPVPPSADSPYPVNACETLRDWLISERKKRTYAFPLVMIPQLNSTTQPGVLWKNRLIANHRRKGTMSDEERQQAPLKHAIERFCHVFPDHFVLTERGRMNLKFEDQIKGRLLGAGFHLQVGYYRDDAPLYDLLLTDAQREDIDRMWRDLYFVTDAWVRQFQDYVYFERAEGKEVITEAEFDFARGEDRTVASRKSMEKFARLYVAAVRKRDLSEDALREIAQYFVDLSSKIRDYEKQQLEARPRHLESLVTFASRAWRRPVTDSEARGLLDFYRQLRDQGTLSHEDAVRDVVVSILVSPHFCYRVDSADMADENHRLTAHSLANRLSYFLWSSMPDDRLVQLASSGALHRQSVLLSEVKRMLQDDRSRALAVEFGGHWLDFRQFQLHVGVDRSKFTQFTDSLRESMFQEPVYFMADLIRRDGSIHDFLEADHTFVDANLAAHYQVPYSSDEADVDGWLRLDQADRWGRGGILPMAVFLTRQSPGLRTSPVKRGYWVIRQVLGEKIPAPPTEVPDLPEDETELGDLTLREVLSRHRAIKSCAACHDRFDFAGLVFEGYGPIGERRTKDLGGKAIEDHTVFDDGSSGYGLEGLRNYLRERRRDQFEDTLCRKLLAYSLGRTLLLSDEPTIIRMKEVMRGRDYRFSSLVETIVTSPQFLNKRKPEAVVQNDK